MLALRIYCYWMTIPCSTPQTLNFPPPPPLYYEVTRKMILVVSGATRSVMFIDVQAVTLYWFTSWWNTNYVRHLDLFPNIGFNKRNQRLSYTKEVSLVVCFSCIISYHSITTRKEAWLFNVLTCKVKNLQY